MPVLEDGTVVPLSNRTRHKRYVCPTCHREWVGQSHANGRFDRVPDDVCRFCGTTDVPRGEITGFMDAQTTVGFGDVVLEPPPPNVEPPPLVLREAAPPPPSAYAITGPSLQDQFPASPEFW